MSASAVLSSARDAGISVSVTPAGKLKLTGHSTAIERLTPALREHKAELISILSAGGAPGRRRSSPEASGTQKRKPPEVSTRLWCIQCGAFPGTLPGGLTYRVGVSFYCPGCLTKSGVSA